MKTFLTIFFLVGALGANAQSKQAPPPTTLRGVLLEQLRTTHNKEDWFVPVNVAVAGLTAQQANWSPGHGGHSVGQLAYHLWFWNSRELAQFKGEKPGAFDGNNDETFNNFNAAQWNDLVKKLDKVMGDWEAAVEAASDQKIAANASLIAHIGTHNAYHVGQILYVRKLQGAWDPSKGVH
jgi:uncharacterized damage-inducible protein DinB